MKIWKTEKIVYFNTKIPKKINNKLISNTINNSNNEIKNPKHNLTSKFSLNKKIKLFKVETFEEYDPDEDKTPNSGKWTLKEQIQFLQALDKFGMKWKKFRKIIKTRTKNQIRSHNQKLFKRLKNCKDEELGIDFTSDKIKNMNDIIKHIKSVNKNFDVVNILLYISGKYSSNVITKNSNIIEKTVNINNIFENDIKSNTNNEINLNKVPDINKVNNLSKEANKQLINNYFDNNNNSFRQNKNIFNSNIYNLMNNFIDDKMIINFVNNINNNINNNIILDSNNQNLNNDYLSNYNKNNSLNNNISENDSLIKNNNANDYINSNKNKI